MRSLFSFVSGSERFFLINYCINLLPPILRDCNANADSQSVQGVLNKLMIALRRRRGREKVAFVIPALLSSKLALWTRGLYTCKYHCIFPLLIAVFKAEWCGNIGQRVPTPASCANHVQLGVMRAQDTHLGAFFRSRWVFDFQRGLKLKWFVLR